jgi:hypothetical protein
MRGRAAAFFLLAGALLAAAVLYALLPFSVAGIASSNAGGVTDEVERAECSAPIRQVVDVPTVSVEADDSGFTIHNAHPACADMGRSRALTSGALLVAAILASVIGWIILQSRPRSLSDDPSAKDEVIASN